MRHGWAWSVLVVAAGAGAAAAEPRALPLTDAAWQLDGASAKVERYEGRDVLSVETGAAYRRDVRLQDGTVDFDVQVTRRRSFVYLMFRMADDRELEEVYLRPHKSALPDALQYAPVYQGSSAWQLYHGPGATAAVAFEPGAWTHVRLVLRGEKAALFVGDMAKPALVVPRLARAPQPGYIALRGFAPPGTGAGPIARYANVAVDDAAPSYDFPSGRSDAARDLAAPALAGSAIGPPFVVPAWSVSRAIAVPNDVALPALPPAEALGEPRRVSAEPSGLVVLHRHVRLPAPDTRDVAAVARLRIRAASAGVRRLDLGFSDVATVFLNGRPLFRSDAHYSYDNPRQEGLIHYGQASVFLPLQQGDNELAVLVSDSFGGWGLMGRFADASGLEVEAPAR
jgi:hypothetical protein